MSADINHIEILRTDGAYFTAEDWYKLQETYREDSRVPSINLLDGITDNGRIDPVKDGKVPITVLWWAGDGSGRGSDFFISEFLSKVHGEIWAAVDWDGGCYLEVWHIKDGVVCVLDLFKALKSDQGIDALIWAMNHQGELIAD